MRVLLPAAAPRRQNAGCQGRMKAAGQRLGQKGCRKGLICTRSLLTPGCCRRLAFHTTVADGVGRGAAATALLASILSALTPSTPRRRLCLRGRFNIIMCWFFFMPLLLASRLHPGCSKRRDVLTLELNSSPTDPNQKCHGHGRPWRQKNGWHGWRMSHADAMRK